MRLVVALYAALILLGDETSRVEAAERQTTSSAITPSPRDEHFGYDDDNNRNDVHGSAAAGPPHPPPAPNGIRGRFGGGDGTASRGVRLRNDVAFPYVEHDDDERRSANTIGPRKPRDLQYAVNDLCPASVLRGEGECGRVFAHCCARVGMQCREKNAYWSACRRTCDPNVEDEWTREKWSCRVIAGTPAAEEPATTTSTTTTTTTTTVAPAGAGGDEASVRDVHGIKHLYASDATKSANDWVSGWTGRGAVTILDNAFKVDPGDPRATMRGMGAIEIGVNGGETRMINSPRLYIAAEEGHGFEDVEFTVYGKWVKDGSPKSSSGLTMVARTNHGEWGDGCTGAGYMARIYYETGQVSFQKEYYHGDSGTIYSASRRLSLFDGGLPTNLEVGIKFVVLTGANADARGGGPDDVVLQFWIDSTGGLDGGTWTKAHQVVDRPGKWKRSSSSDGIPSSCEVQNGDTVLGARQFCFLRGDGGSGTEIGWRKASIRNITPAVVNDE